MCCCPQPNINGNPGYSWDGKAISTRPVDPPSLTGGDMLLIDAPGRCGGMDSHCHHYRLVKSASGRVCILARHGGGSERVSISLPRGFDFSTLDYWTLNAVYHAYSEGRSEGSGKEALRYRAAFVEGRLKKRKLPGRGEVRVWIEVTA